jgi:hypothetical protein
MSAEAAEALPGEEVLSTMVQTMGGGATSYEATALLWETYDPWIIWPMLGSVGALSVAGMVWNYIQAQRSSSVAP